MALRVDLTRPLQGLKGRPALPGHSKSHLHIDLKLIYCILFYICIVPYSTISFMSTQVYTKVYTKVYICLYLCTICMWTSIHTQITDRKLRDAAGKPMDPDEYPDSASKSGRTQMNSTRWTSAWCSRSAHIPSDLAIMEQDFRGSKRLHQTYER